MCTLFDVGCHRFFHDLGGDIAEPIRGDLRLGRDTEVGPEFRILGQDTMGVGEGGCANETEISDRIPDDLATGVGPDFNSGLDTDIGT